MMEQQDDVAAPASGEDPTRLIQAGNLFASKRHCKGDWTLDTGEGSRQYVEHVDFATPFDALPKIVVFLSQIDIMAETDRRVCVSVERQDRNGFDIGIGTWNDTKVWSCNVSWIAFDKSFTTPAAKGSPIEIGRSLFGQKGNAHYKLHKGKGDRSFTERVQFTTKGFLAPPTVVVGLSALDILDEADHRLAVTTSEITSKGFNLCVGTWQDSKVWSSEITWIAFDSSFLNAAKGLRLATGRWPFKKGPPGYTLHEGSGDRLASQRISFPRNFADPPNIITFLSAIDILNKADDRAKVTASNLSNSAFNLNLATWGDTQVWSASCSWFAFGPAVSALVGTEKTKLATPPAKIGDAKAQKLEAAPLVPAAASAPAAAPAGEKHDPPADDDEKLCKICMDADINICFVPCGHLAVCEDCSKLVTGPKSKNECPICKTRVKTCVRIYKT